MNKKSLGTRDGMTGSFKTTVSCLGLGISVSVGSTVVYIIQYVNQSKRYLRMAASQKWRHRRLRNLMPDLRGMGCKDGAIEVRPNGQLSGQRVTG